MISTTPIKISIGIPIYNEEKNIEKLLWLIEDQKNISYKIDSVILVNDCSTDDSGLKIKTYANRSSLPIDFVDLKENKGKANALNIIYNMAEGELLITFDSDAVFSGKNCIEEWIQPFLKDKEGEIGLLCCSLKLINKSSALSRVYNFAIIYRDIISGLIPDNPNFANGYMQIIPRKVFKNIKYPKKLSRIDAFMYLWIKRAGLKFILIHEPKLHLYAEESKGFLWYLRTQERVAKVPREHVDEFGEEIKLLYKYPPLYVLVLPLIKTFIKNPVDGIIFIAWKSLSLIVNKLSKRDIPANWRKFNT